VLTEQMAAISALSQRLDAAVAMQQHPMMLVSTSAAPPSPGASPRGPSAPARAASLDLPSSVRDHIILA
jgi:hypothetical protein